MKIPKSLDIFGDQISVVSVDIGEDDVAGLYDPVKKEIRLSPLLSKKDLKITLLHELIHAVLHRLNYHGVLDGNTQEFICDHIAVAISENFEIKNLNK